MPYIYSTLSSDVDYAVTNIEPGTPGAYTAQKLIRVNGGAGVAQPGTMINNRNVTPLGVETEVSDEELEILKKDNTFKTHVQHKFIKYFDRKYDVKDVAADLEAHDASAPLTDEDYKDDGKGRVGRLAKPKIGNAVK